MTASDTTGVASWAEAFAQARLLLVKDQLTAVAVVSEREYAGGTYIATHLEEFSRVFGCVDKVLDNLEAMSPMLYKDAKKFRLVHRAAQYPRPEGVVDGWILVVIYDDMATRDSDGLPPGTRRILELTEGKHTLHVPEVALEINDAKAMEKWRAYLKDVCQHPENYPEINIAAFDDFSMNVAMMIESGTEDVVLKP